MNLKPITFTSDFGVRDFYAAAVEGKILSMQPLSCIVVISHKIRQYDIFQASVVVRNAYKYFPDGTVHLILVNNASRNNGNQIAIHHNNHYFVGPDSGIYSLLFDETPSEIVLLDRAKCINPTFPELDICTYAAVHLSEGKSLKDLGEPIKEIEESILYKPTESEKSIKGTVIYIDNYHNVITNISKKMFDRKNNGSKFVISFGRYYASRISATYDYAPEGELVAVFGSSGLLEIALYKASAQNLLGIKLYDTVRIDFE